MSAVQLAPPAAPSAQAPPAQVAEAHCELSVQAAPAGAPLAAVGQPAQAEPKIPSSTKLVHQAIRTDARKGFMTRPWVERLNEAGKCQGNLHFLPG